MAEKVGEEPRIPRKCARQIQRNNVPATTPSEYYKRAISIPMLDHLESEIILALQSCKALQLKVCQLSQLHCVLLLLLQV